MKIGIDLDDVIAEFTESLMDFHGKKYGKKVNTSDIKEWKWWIYWGTTREEAIRRSDEFHEQHDVADIPPIKDAISSLNRLMEKNKIFIITSRPSRYKPKVEQWFAYHLKKKLEVIHADDFHKDGRATKAQICKELKVAVMIEDSPETALDCAKNGIKVLLFDQPWNKDIVHNNLNRVSNWKEALDYIEKISNPQL